MSTQGSGDGADVPDAQVREIAARHVARPGGLLPALHAVQDELGYVPPESVPTLADLFNLSRAEVHGVISFYHLFRTTPPGRRTLYLCRAEACQAMGARALEEHAMECLGIGFHETTADRRFSLEPIYCLGNCACSPAVMIDDCVHGRVTPEGFDALLEEGRGAPEPATPGGSAAATPGVSPAATPGVSLAVTSGAPEGSHTVFVPRDTTALSMGADGVAEAIAAEAAWRGESVTVVRNGSRGLYWLEPMIEVEADGVRHAYGPVQAADVPALFDAGFLTAGEHGLGLGPTEKIPWLAGQSRLTFARAGITDPLSLEDYRAHGGYDGLAKAVGLSREEIVEIVTESGLRGRGGAAFPTGIKWRTVLNAEGSQKYVTCNADEGDSGTYADRMVMESDPFVVIEGMTIAGLAVGATMGYIYLRAEYPLAIRIMNEAIESAEAAGLLGENVMDSGQAFRLEVREAAGAYICGEETSMLESLEGKRGMIRYRPPLPAIKGLFGAPTIVNNVITLASVPIILAEGAEYYRDYGTGRSRGTLTVQLAGNIKRGGLVEIGFGRTLRELLEDFGGGTATGRPIRAVQAGGPLGAYIHPSQFDTPLDYEAFAEIDGMIGHGGLVVFDDTVDMGEQARFAMEFCAIESCGKCTPCRIGAVRGVEVIDRILSGVDESGNLQLLRDLCDTMVAGSLCALGGMAPYPVISVLDHFPEDLRARQVR